MHDGRAGGDPLERLVEALRDGGGDGAPARAVLLAHPELASFLRELLDPSDAPAPPQADADAGEAPARLGDFRLVRELGRGGMGVVYEAYQVSLGRRVALKVLAPALRGDETLRRRFEREARAAAGLHHTNIVPVFAVGEEGGIPYYAMQYIRGQGLGELVRRLRALRAPTATALPAGSEAGSAPTLARVLEAVPFADLTTEPECPPVEPPPAAASTAPEPARPAEGPDARGGATPAREVARIGLQVADALAYAHRQGVLHRDIKPTNLLLDVAGTAWVTDFGLAKAIGTDPLTEAGGVLGTLRYIAPEGLEGRADARSDVYGLGVTLYELLALRPAFDAADRAHLVEQVARGAAPPLRTLNPDVPRDLETVVAKAMAAAPRDRYATADALADDLRRFLADRPIRARRLGPLEQAARWCRRNPVVAGLLLLVGALLATLAAGAAVAAGRLAVALGRAERAEVVARQDLWEAYVSRARSERLGNRPGRRFDGLDALARAAALHVFPRRRHELRDEAIAGLALADLRPDGRWDCPPGDGGIGFDADLRRAASSDERGAITIWDGAEVRFRLPGPEPGLPAWRLDFRPDGRYLAARHHPQHDTHAVRVRIWDLERRALVLDLPAEACGPGLAWAPDGRLAVCRRDGPVTLYDPETGRAAGPLGRGVRGHQVAFDPRGRRAAVAGVEPFDVRIVDLDTGRIVREWPHPTTVTGLAWHPAGRQLASACDDQRVRVLEVDDPKADEAVLAGHQHGLSGLAFHPGGDLLASTSWDGTLELWDVGTGRAVVELASAWWAGPQFSADGRRLAGTLEGSELVFWEVEPGRVCRTLRGRPLPYLGPWTVDFRPDGALLVVASLDGVRVWDPASGRALGELPAGNGAGALFLPDGAHVVTHGAGGLLRWLVLPDGRGGLEIGRPDTLRGPPRSAGSGRRLTLGRARDGARLALTDPVAGEAIVLDPADPSGAIRLPGNPEISQAALSPDGRWLATATFHGPGVKVWDLQTRTLVWHHDGGDAAVAFSPDGRWLVTGDYRAYRFWEVGTWRDGPSWPRRDAGLAGSIAFTADGAIAAVAHTDRDVRLVAVASGTTLATLTAPDPRIVTELAFSPDGKRLAVGAQGQLVQLWDLRAVRGELARLGLDWADPPPNLAAQSSPAPASAPTPQARSASTAKPVPALAM